MKTLKSVTLILMALIMNCAVSAQVNDIYINPDSGKDQNPGSKEQPLRSLFEAAKRVNQSNGSGAIANYLSEGIYGLDANVTFHPANWHISKEQRLTIRAAVLPDDADWKSDPRHTGF